ncbi:hypothetical protein [Plantactinospora sp. KLBMP9567]|uniref:hypothetical protein n=1 Tax=Plantactinospora sp. KLBMP9567 TaxID=3085900 RepID=UPI0029813817|nr:hypothetical protein [Plantactinospora sp. KLBMP9567]MDW5323921.1 hypothetical protein [Plantactinospora sp. KLBMP9567]
MAENGTTKNGAAKLAILLVGLAAALLLLPVVGVGWGQLDGHRDKPARRHQCPVEAEREKRPPRARLRRRLGPDSAAARRR